MNSTKRIDGVTGVTVGDDWITLNFEGYDITIDKLKISNLLLDQAKKELGKERAKNEINMSLGEAITSMHEDFDELLGWVKKHRDDVVDGRTWSHQEIDEVLGKYGYGMLEVYCTEYPEEGSFFITQTEYDEEPETYTIVRKLKDAA